MRAADLPYAEEREKMPVAFLEAFKRTLLVRQFTRDICFNFLRVFHTKGESTMCYSIKLLNIDIFLDIKRNYLK